MHKTFFSHIFQSTLPRRERRYTANTVRSVQIFQSTLPRRERPRSIFFNYFYKRFQSTLPRRERPGFHQNHAVANLISIHAPAKGATQGHENTVYSYKYFNPRSREGSDLIRKFTRDIFSISIHAPAKGATCSTVVLSSNLIYFNPRSREGSDLNNSSILSTNFYFNPRSREGSDFFLVKSVYRTMLFQSTLPRRERLYSKSNL